MGLNRGKIGRRRLGSGFGRHGGTGDGPEEPGSGQEHRERLGAGSGTGRGPALSER